MQPSKKLKIGILAGLVLMSLLSESIGNCTAPPDSPAPQKIRIPSGVELAYSLAGPPGAPVIVFVHGYLGDMEGYRFLQKGLQDRYQVLIYDHPGHGASEHPSGKTPQETAVYYSMPQLAKNLDELLTALHLDQGKVVLAGSSMGGFVLFTYVFAHPEKVRALIPMSTNMGYTEDAIKGNRQFYELLTGIDSAHWDVRAITESSLQMSFTAAWVAEHPKEYQRSLEAALNTSREAWIHCLGSFGLGEYDFWKRAAEIKVPVMVLHGKMDQVQPWQNAQRIQREIPDCQAVFFEDGSHVFFVEQGPAVLDTISRFLESLP